MPDTPTLRLLFVAAALSAALAAGCRSPAPSAKTLDDPRAMLPAPSPHTVHAKLIAGPFEDGPAVTRRCLECHEDAARQVMGTSHWTWLGDRVKLPGTDQYEKIGKANLVNNFCIAAKPNLPACTRCHAGYGWEDDSFDFGDESQVDCLVCHDTSGTYRKGIAGRVAEGVDLVAAAKSVGAPTRRNCGTCHFAGGGGDAVKHGDMDGSMYHPSERVDIHMGRYDMACQDCHRTVDHEIPGCAMSVCTQREKRVTCTDCHSETPHYQERLNAHYESVACQTCHLPAMAVHWDTKMEWDWSQAGQDLDIDDPHVYMKKKGRFSYDRKVEPEYYWYNGLATRYLTGERVDPSKVVSINTPLGDIRDAKARIWPFKVHRGKQPYDKVHGHLLTPKTWGEGGYWTEFDWDKANRLGSEAMGLPYSGEFDFASTEMYWPLSHMVQSRSKALQCIDCHGEGGRMDWEALGYGSDPAFRGGRRQLGFLEGEEAK